MADPTEWDLVVVGAGGAGLRATFGNDHGLTAAQLAIAWVAAQGEDIVPLIGTKRRSRLAEALAALDVTLSAGELAAITAAVPADQVAGDRYDAAQMRGLDSER